MSLAAPALLALAVVQPASVEPPPAAEIPALERALPTFQRLCVAPLPSPLQFTRAMNTIGVRWHKVDKTPAEIFALGNSWRSVLGEITYHNPPPVFPRLGGPACHFVFRTDGGYVHASAAAAVGAALGLPAGRNTGNRREPQMRWETRFLNGMMVRFFLTSNVEMPGGRGARLSVSRRHGIPPPLEERR